MYKKKKIKREVAEVMMSISEVAGYLWEYGWAERNAGNISVNITSLTGNVSIHEEDVPHFDLDAAYPQIANEIIIISGTGTRMRNVAVNPFGNLLIVKMNQTGTGYYVLSPLWKKKIIVSPTTELDTHLSIQEMFLISGSRNKVVLHAHVTELIALTHIPEFCKTKKINDVVFSMHPETSMFIPEGVEFIPFLKPGTKEIANATVNALKNRNIAIWEKHGVFAAGPDIQEAFDSLDILAKAVSIYFICKSAGIEPSGLKSVQ